MLSLFKADFIKRISLISGGYTHLGFGALRSVNGFGLVKLRFHVTLGMQLHSKRLPSGSNKIRYEFTVLNITIQQFFTRRHRRKRDS